MALNTHLQVNRVLTVSVGNITVYFLAISFGQLARYKITRSSFSQRNDRQTFSKIQNQK